MSRIERDSQRGKLYQAERLIPKGIAYPTLDQTRGYVDYITGSRWWYIFTNGVFGVYADGTVEIRDGRGRSKPASLTGQAAITLPRAARCERIILHELAHQACDARYGPDKAAHGRHFASVYAALIGRWMGIEAKRALLDAYRAKGVCWRLP